MQSLHGAKKEVMIRIRKDAGLTHTHTQNNTHTHMRTHTHTHTHTRRKISCAALPGHRVSVSALLTRRTRPPPQRVPCALLAGV
jgi:hypothetical protein